MLGRCHALNKELVYKVSLTNQYVLGRDVILAHNYVTVGGHLLFIILILFPTQMCVCVHVMKVKITKHSNIMHMI